MNEVSKIKHLLKGLKGCKSISAKLLTELIERIITNNSN